MLLFITAAIAVQTSVRHAIAQQEAIRQAELLRSYVLRMQIDEETGLRGFVITKDRSFLSPFEQARRNLSTGFTRLRSELADVAPSLLPLARQEQQINAQWMTTVALPTIARPTSAGAHATAGLRAKALVDGFRNISAAIAISLAHLANAEDDNASATTARILIGSVAFGIVLAAALLFYAVAQLRLARALTVQADEYERLKRFSATLQEAFLAEPLPRLASVSFDAVYAPALEESRVGGDWYGAFALPDGRIYFSMGDVAGHGVGASVTMARIRQTILSIAMHVTDPALVLSHANEVLRLRTETMVTALCGFVQPQTNEVTYASAGHPAPILVSSDGRATLLPASGAPLGVTTDPTALTYTRRVAPGSMLVCYTDGLIEFDHDILRGERRLLDVSSVVARAGVDRPASAILRRALGASVQRDDIAVLAIHFETLAQTGRVEEPSAQALVGSWDIERANPVAARDARVAFVDRLQSYANADAHACELIFGELVANALEHGEGTIAARLYNTQRGLLLVVSDAGGGTGAVRAREAKTAPPALELRGRGLHIVRMLAQDVHVADRPGCTIFALLPEERASESA